MPRQTLTKTTAPGPTPTAATAITWTAEDTTNHSQFAFTGKEILLVYNSGASPYTFTVYSVADEQGRTKDITTESIAAGAIRTVGPFTIRPGWRQTDGNIYVDASNVAVKFAVIQLP